MKDVISRSAIEIYESHESGVSDSWCWSASIHKNKDGSYGLDLSQTIWESEEEAEPASYELEKFTNGSELFGFLQSTWESEHECGLDQDTWTEIVGNIQKIDAHLAGQVRAAAQEYFEPTNPVEPPEDLDISNFVKHAKRDSPTHSGGGAMWAAIAESQRTRSEITSYVKAYLKKNGSLPDGRHHVMNYVVTFQNIDESGD